MSSDFTAADVPQHVAVIMDGNGRWALARHLPRAAGHRAGTKTAREIVESSRKIGIKTLTLFAFSSENWRRPEGEVGLLMDLFRRSIRRELKDLKTNNVQLHFVGARERFAPALQQQMAAAERDTQANDGLQLIIAVDYGGRWDIAQAARSLARQTASGEIDPESIDEQQLARHMSLNPFKAPDLFIRTGGECRLSNFLLWDLAYSELYFSDILWPDFDTTALKQAVAWYGSRERRFGCVASSSDER